MSLFQRLISPFKEFGPVSGALYLLDQFCVRYRLRFRIFDYDMMVQPVADTPIVPKNLKKSFEVRQVKEGDPLLHRIPVPKEIIASRFRQGSMCLGAFNRNQFVGYQWLHFGPYQEDEVRCTLVPRPADTTAFDYDIYIFPEHRIGLVFVTLWDAANALLRERGFHFSASRLSRFNLGSRRAHEHFKWRKVARAVFFRGKRGQLMLASKAPFVHLSFSASNCPRLCIDAIDKRG